jgi:drug/metabolite transporter (DMT)-like permease
MTSLKIWQTTAAIAIGMSYWILVLALPPTSSSWPGWSQVIIGLVGICVIAVGIMVARAGFKKAKDDPKRPELFALGVFLVLVGLLLIVIAFMTTQPMTLDPERRFAIGVGGLAIASFVYAATQFDTVRAAASVPIVVLLIGIVVWPKVTTLVDNDVRKALITWMGVILAANGVSEAAKQVGESNAKAKASADVDVTSRGDLA